MFRRLGSPHRFFAALCLAWLVLGALGSSLMACCAAAVEPCCVTALSGHGCAACATTPVLPGREAAVPALPPPLAAVVAAIALPLSAAAHRPWRPPD